MPRPLRSIPEHALRATAVAALGVLLWRALVPAPAAPPGVDVADARAMDAALARWGASPVAAGHAALDSLPDPVTRDRLAALRRAGMRVTWSAERAPALAAAAERAADPMGGVRLRVAAPAGAVVQVRDALGALDTVRAARGGAAALLPSAGDTVAARLVGATARAATPGAPRLGEIVLLAAAGWEGKFAAAALEERGWRVRARFALAPGIVAAQACTERSECGADAPIDTARVAAVVALDASAAPRAAAIARFVRAGGGLVLGPDAAREPALRALAAGEPGARVELADLAAPGADSAFAGAPLARLRADAVALRTRRVGGRDAVVAAARRVGAGRVVQLAEEATWRRRFAGADGAAEHRAWWAGAVAAAAYAPVTAVANPAAAGGVQPVDALPPDGAPLAHAVDALGAPAAAPPRRRDVPVRERVPDAMLHALAAAALLGEVAARRRRGAP